MAISPAATEKRPGRETKRAELPDDPSPRTPEQIAAARERILAAARKPRPLPAGKSLEAVVVGSVQDEEREEDVIAALADIS